MRIVTFAEFVQLPDGVVYSDYEPCIVGGLFVRGQVYVWNGKASDFAYRDILASPGCPDENPVTLSVDEDYGRDGLFDYDRQFAVYEDEDLAKMIEALQAGMGKVVKEPVQ